MAFCTNCGANMDPNAHFCTKCGKTVSAAAPPVAPSAPAAGQTYTPPPQTYTPQTYTPAPQSGGSGVGKILLIIAAVLCVIFVLSVLGIVAAIHRAHRFRDRTFVTHNGRDSSVTTPFGRASTSHGDAKDVARQIGVDVYPGAEGGESSTAQFGNMTTASVKFTTPDSVDKVAAFYKTRMSGAMVTQDSSHFSMVGSDKNGTITITAQDNGSGTNIEIAKVGGIKINAQ